MGFSEAVQVGLNKFFTPTGRASRSEFWWYALCLWIVSGVFVVIGGFIMNHGMEQAWLGIITEVIDAILVASIVCASIRRLHDTGKSGWNVLWYLLPLVGWIIEVVLLCRASQPGENQYGPEPR